MLNYWEQQSFTHYQYIIVGGGYELLFRENLESLEALDGVNDILYPEFGQRVFSTRRDLIDQFGFNKELHSKWSGIMAFGKDKRPLVGLHSPDVGYAVRLGGMGVALGSLVGSRLAGLICIND